MSNDKNRKGISSFDNNERLYLLVAYLLANPGYVSLIDLTEFLHYSRTTILTDISKAKSFLKKYNIEITYDRTKGYSLNGSSDQQMKIANHLIFENMELVSRDDFEMAISNNKLIKFVKIFIIQFEKEFKAKFSDSYFDSLVILIAIILLRNCGKNFIGVEADSFVEQTYEYKYIKNYLQTHGKNIQIGWLKWITIEFLSANVYLKQKIQLNENDRKIVTFVHQMVESFKSQTLVDIPNQMQFEHRLVNHLRPACFRVKYDLSTIAIVNMNIDENTKILADIIHQQIKPVEEWLGTPFPEAEIKLLAVYFGTNLIDNISTSTDLPRYHAVVVCSNGIILSQILMKELKKLFPELKIILALSAREFTETNLDFDVVFSTIPLSTTKKQYIITPNMSNQRKVELRYRVLNDLGISKLDSKVDDVIDVLKNYISSSEITKLREKIRLALVDTDEIGVNKSLPNLMYYIDKDAIILKNEFISWSEAIDLSTKPLMNKHKITQGYVDILKKDTDTPTNYSFLGKSMAIPHSKPENGVYSDGIGFLVSRKGILFPGGRVIHLVVPIAVLEGKKHYKAINQLAKIATNEKVIKKFLKADSTEDVYSILASYVESGDDKK